VPGRGKIRQQGISKGKTNLAYNNQKLEDA
jgi:hypothetical protein